MQLSFKECMVLMGVLILFAMCSAGNKGGSKTDGVFESACEKMDRGQPLNQREAQRIHDIIHFDQNNK